MSSPPSPNKIIVTGATSIIGPFLLARLLEAGYEVHALTRKNNPDTAGVSRLFWHQVNVDHPEQLPTVNAVALIHLAPLWLLPPLLPALSSRQIKRVIAFGSTSLFSKAHSADASERQVAARLNAAEEAICERCGVLGMNWTIFRPTLVYDCGRDKNITRIARFVERYGFFPLLGKARGLRQPVHADDLAQACLLALDQPVTFNKAYNLSGGEILAYREMVEKIFGALGKRIRFLIVPAWLFHLGIRGAYLFPGKRNITLEMATRMNTDLCFSHSDATKDFGFAPRPFLPAFTAVTPFILQDRSRIESSWIRH
jgi:nucleoside-diphosphate-sugar epimerase